MSEFVPGQRWRSEMEPELGIGIVSQVEHRRVHIHFPVAACERQYVRDGAPLKRVRFRAGDQVQGQNNVSFIVTEVQEKHGLYLYRGEHHELQETDLAHSLTFNSPEDRFFSGQIDPSAVFNLRYEARQHQHQMHQAAIRGFIGGRIELIPHQFYIAQEVVCRHIPRVLLADEVGLGKTIEACLILHRLLVSGRVSRVLILVPESLVHQWFIELYRRFNLFFHIVDEDYCQTLEVNDPTGNPFLDDQLFIADLQFLTHDERRAQQALQADWDLIVIDEAHHLEEAGHAYEVVAALAGKSPGVLLLTATPEQVGQRHHFARLKLLDPARYHDFDAYLKEAKNYRNIARAAGKLADHKKIVEPELKTLLTIFRNEPVDFIERIQAINHAQVEFRYQVLGQLLDQYGIGRVIFRNTRAAMANFPKRIVQLAPILDRSDKDSIKSQLAMEFMAEMQDRVPAVTYHLNRDPRILWLAQLLRHLKGKKILLICRTWQKAEAIESALRLEINAKTALFHEGMPLLQRDRKAAWFSEQDGAQLLICSEIGSEGRNFQFAHHLILFDVPLNPELLEQRMGRLDRIGQKKDIFIHVPFIEPSPQAALIHWYNEGLNAFEKNVPGLSFIYEQFGSYVKEIGMRYSNSPPPPDAELSKLIEKTRQFSSKLASRLRKGRDRLLELNSFRPEVADRLVRAIQAVDQDANLGSFMERLFDHYGVICEDLDTKTLLLTPGNMTVAAFPGLQEDGTRITYDRKQATVREEVEFLTWDHPMVTGALDLLLGSEKGNSALAIWEDSGAPEILLESIFVLEGVAPMAVQIERFLPVTPIRVLVNQQLQDCSEKYPQHRLIKLLKEYYRFELSGLILSIQDQISAMLTKSRRIAHIRAAEILQSSTIAMQEKLGYEAQRLRTLKRVNSNISDQEIALTEAEMRALGSYIASAQLRLDALRLIYKGARDQ